jgi:hypothetical protein
MNTSGLTYRTRVLCEDTNEIMDAWVMPSVRWVIFTSWGNDVEQEQEP